MAEQVPTGSLIDIDTPPPSRPGSPGGAVGGRNLMDTTHYELSRMFDSPAVPLAQSKWLPMTPNSMTEPEWSPSYHTRLQRTRSNTPEVEPFPGFGPEVEPFPGFGPSTSTAHLRSPIATGWGAAPGSSGELEISSDADTFAGLGFKRGVKKAMTGKGFRVPQTLRERTARDLEKLRKYGVEVDFPIQRQGAGTIAEGTIGQVYRCHFTPKINRIGLRASKYMSVDLQRAYAAKYMEFGGRRVNNRARLSFEIEKHCMKALSGHPNIVGLILAVNVGERVQVEASDRKTAEDFAGMDVYEQQDHVPRHFIAFNRVFVIMELATKGSLQEFATDSRHNDQQVIDFADQLSSGMSYFHDKGIVHCDAHWGNVLLFTHPRDETQLVAKWCDFGEAIARTHWTFMEDKDAANFENKELFDCYNLGTILTKLINLVNKELSEGADLGGVQGLADELIADTNTSSLKEVWARHQPLYRYHSTHL